MDKCILSIIVPVYNVECYLEKCVNSLINQNISNYEILLINDGSTDESEKICLKYTNKYPEIIKYYKKDNSGLSDTRNLGIKNAHGKYLCFVDSDDYYEINCLNNFKNIMELGQADLIYFGYYFDKEDYSKKKYSYNANEKRLYDSKDFIKKELSERNLPIPACFAFYKRDLIVDNNLYFSSGILHEDERWSPQILLKSKKIYTTKDVIYHYIQRSGSITHAVDKTKNGLDIIETALIINDLANEIDDNELKKLLKNRTAMLYMKGVTIGGLHRKQFKRKIKRFFPLKNTCFIIDKVKSIVFLINLKLYVFLNKLMKGG